MLLANLLTLPVAAVAQSRPDEDSMAETLSLAAVALPVISLGAMVVWSAIAAVNAGRVRRRNKHLRRPRAMNAALSWFAAPVVAIAFVAFVVWRGESFESLTSGDSIEDEMMVIGVAFALVFLVAAYLPYGVLGRVSRWVGADHHSFRKWFFAPIIGAVVSGLIVFFGGLIERNGDGTIPPVLFVLAFLVAMALPWLLWVLAGNRAMADLEASVERLHHRAVEEYRDEVRKFNDG